MCRCRLKLLEALRAADEALFDTTADQSMQEWTSKASSHARLPSSTVDRRMRRFTVTHTAAVLIAHVPVRFRGCRPTHLPAAIATR